MEKKERYKKRKWAAPAHSERNLLKRKKKCIVPNVRPVAGDENEMSISGTPAAGCVTRYANRRRTDLMPTIPSPRERSNDVAAGIPMSGRSSSAKSFTRSPGRTYSMSRLDQLAQPRSRRTQQASSSTYPSPSSSADRQSLTASSMSRSMSHLAPSVGGARLLGAPLKRTDNSRSMGNLPGSGSRVATPRPTRAERLRRKAREHQQQQQLQHHQQQTGKKRTLLCFPILDRSLLISYFITSLL